MVAVAAARVTPQRYWEIAAALEAAETAAQTTALKRTVLHEQPGMLLKALQKAAEAAEAGNVPLEARMARWRTTQRMAARTVVKERRWWAARLMVPCGPGGRGGRPITGRLGIAHWR